MTGVLFSPALTKGDENEEEVDELNDEDAFEEEEEDDEEEAFNPYLFISGLPPHHTVVIRDKICLPSVKFPQTRPTLALDLDETLVHCTVEPIAKPDLTFPVTFNGTFYQVYVRKRPYLDYFLETVSKSFEVVVFTASQKVSCFPLSACLSMLFYYSLSHISCSNIYSLIHSLKTLCHTRHIHSHIPYLPSNPPFARSLTHSLILLLLAQLSTL